MVGFGWVGLGLVGFGWVWIGWIGLVGFEYDWIWFDWIGLDLIRILIKRHSVSVKPRSYIEKDNFRMSMYEV